MTPGERIRKLRKALDLTQQTFAERIGISRNNIATYETGKSNPGEAVISLICREFNVNESWLRNGEGDMFVKAPDNSLEALALEYNLNKFAQSVIQKIVNLKPEQWEAVSNFIAQLVDMLSKSDADTAVPSQTLQPPPPPEPTTPDVMAMLTEMKEALAETRRENAELKKRIAGIEEVDQLNAIAHGLWDSIPHYSGSSDAETTEEDRKQKAAHQYDH